MKWYTESRARRISFQIRYSYWISLFLPPFLFLFIIQLPDLFLKLFCFANNLFEMTTDFHAFSPPRPQRVRNNSVLLNRSETDGGYVKVQYNSATLTVTCIGAREQENDSDRLAIAFQLEPCSSFVAFDVHLPTASPRIWPLSLLVVPRSLTIRMLVLERSPLLGRKINGKPKSYLTERDTYMFCWFIVIRRNSNNNVATWKHICFQTSEYSYTHIVHLANKCECCFF